MNSPRRHVLVTGGAGFIGSHLVERLLAEGRRVVVIDDLSTGSLDNLRAVQRHPGLRVVTSRVSRVRHLGRLLTGAAGVFHLAARVGVDLVTQSAVRTVTENFEETAVLLEAAAGRAVPCLLASSSEVYGRGRKRDFAETDDLVIGPPACARWSYACSKLAEEFLALGLARERGLPVVIARLFNIAGPRQTGRHGMVLPRFLAAARRGEPLRVYGDGRQTRCFCWVGDAVEALARLLACPAARGEVFNVGSTEEVSIRGLAERVIRTLGSKSAIEQVPYEQAQGPGFEDMRRRRPAVKKLERWIGYRPSTPLETIIRETALAGERRE
jgi:UDP-glucose 4-epimerase